MGFRSRVVSTGASFPKTRLTNEELSKRFDKPEEYFVEKTGIRARTIAADNESTHTFALDASKKALDASGINPADIELVITATETPDYIMPCASCLIQKDLELVNAAAFDISAACAGWIFAISVADQYIRTGKFKNALVIGADTLSKLRNPEDRATSMIFGDAAGAAVLESVPEKEHEGIIDTSIFSMGQHKDAHIVPNGGSANPITEENVNDPGRYMQMKGIEVFRGAVGSMTRECRKLLDRNSLNPGDIDVFIPHQANINIALKVAAQLEIPAEKIFENIENHGHVSTACHPTAFSRAMESKAIKRGDLVLISSFGAGFNVGAALIRW